MFGVFVEVDNRDEDRDDRMRGLREELAPAMKLTPGFVSGVFATNDPDGTGMMLLVYDSRPNAEAIAGSIELGSHPRPGVTVIRVDVVEVAATA
jgi:hypothetical protein